MDDPLDKMLNFGCYWLPPLQVRKFLGVTGGPLGKLGDLHRTG